MKSTRLKIIDRILEVIGESHTIAVCSHMRPDGDCIGSSLGLALALLERGKDTTQFRLITGEVLTYRAHMQHAVHVHVMCM